MELIFFMKACHLKVLSSIFVLQLCMYYFPLKIASITPLTAIHLFLISHNFIITKIYLSSFVNIYNLHIYYSYSY